MTPKRRPKNLLASHKADVSYSRAGLTIGVSSVPAEDASLVSKAILDCFRGLVAAGYDELLEHSFSAHAGGYDVPDDADIDAVTLPPEAKAKRIGF